MLVLLVGLWLCLGCCVVCWFVDVSMGFVGCLWCYIGRVGFDVWVG